MSPAFEAKRFGDAEVCLLSFIRIRDQFVVGLETCFGP
jgi:hypothetical protein